MTPLRSKFLLTARDYYELLDNQGLELEGAEFEYEGFTTSKIIEFLKYIDVIEIRNELIYQKELDWLEKNRYSTLQSFLLLYLKVHNQSFAWMKRATLGRQEILLILQNSDSEGLDMYNCLKQCCLTGKLDDASSIWWTELSALSRNLQEDRYAEIGRIGEELSFEYEKRRLDKSPEKTYIEDIGAGYDLLSWTNAGTQERLCIEIKTTERGIDNDQAAFYLSRNEYLQSIQKQNYVFHFWDIKNKNSPSLAVVKKKEVYKHMPEDQGEGEWQNVKILFKPFEDKFTRVN